jgi:hypothetical protein
LGSEPDMRTACKLTNQHRIEAESFQNWMDVAVGW